MEKVGIKGFPVSQNGQDFIIGKVSIEYLLKFTRYTERLITGFDENEKPIYNNHVQRKVEKARVSKIADFLINDPEAMFPTNIVLNIPTVAIAEQRGGNDQVEIIFDDEVVRQIEQAKNGVSDTDVYVTIIDGQHRIRGIEEAIDRLKKIAENNELMRNRLNSLLNIELVVSFFIDKSLEYQAMIFSTINRTQKKVSQDLVSSLFGLTTEDTPYKTALEVVLALNAHPSSPFYRRIKLYGGEYSKKTFSPPLSQATMIKNIVKYISVSLREADNDRYRKRKELLKNDSGKYLPFRRFYAEDRDDMISNCIYYFFNSIKRTLGGYWDYDGVSKPNNILQSTVGFEALFRIMSKIMEANNISDFNKDTFDKFIIKLRNLEYGNTEKYPISTKGKTELIRDMEHELFEN